MNGGVGLAVGLMLAGCVAHRGAVFGSVSRSDGPVSGCRVQLLRSPADVTPLESRTDARGNYRFEHLPGGKYLVRAEGAPGEQLAPLHAEQAEIDLPYRGIRAADLRLIRQDEGGLISGLVADQFGRPVVGASVCASCPGRFGECDTSAEQGHFVFKWVPRGDCAISATPDWRQHDAFHSAHGTASAGQTDVRLVLTYDGSVKGRVLDEHGGLVADFRVGESAFTQGWFELARSAKKTELEIAARDLATEVVPLPAPDSFGDIVLPPTVLTRGDELRGRVIDDATGGPVDSAVIQLPASLRRNRYPAFTGCKNCDDARRERMLPQVLSGKDGAFVFPHLSVRQNRLMVAAPGYADQLIDAVRGRELVVRLQRGAIVCGRVIDATGSGVAGALVLVVRDPRLQGETNADGSFELSGLETRAYRLGVELPERSNGPVFSRYVAWVEAKVGQVVHVDLRERRGSTRVVIERAHEGPIFRLLPGDVRLPPSAEEFRELVDEGMRCLPFGPCEFEGVPAGRHTLVQWRRQEERVVAETQAIDVSGANVSVKWSPGERRSYPAPSTEDEE